MNRYIAYYCTGCCKEVSPCDSLDIKPEKMFIKNVLTLSFSKDFNLNFHTNPFVKKLKISKEFMKWFH